MTRKFNYRKMHMISQEQYEKLKKCINDEKEKTKLSIPDIPDYSHAEESTPFQSEYINPKPGPSNINPETGEYYHRPDITPDEFKYENTSQYETYGPQSSFFESFTTPEGQYIPPVKGKKTNDPTKIKKSTQFKPSVYKSRPDLIVRRPRLSTIIESPLETARDADQPMEEAANIRSEIPDFTFSEEHRPMRTSTPLPQYASNIRQEIPDFTFSEEHRPLRTSTPLPQPSIQRVQTRKQKYIPLKSCKPPKRVIYSEGEQKILDKTNLNKFQCSVCFKFYSSKNTLKKHKSKQHNIVPRTEQPIEVMQNYQNISHPLQQAEMEYQQQHPEIEYQQQHPEIEYQQQHPHSSSEVQQLSTTSEQPALEYATAPPAIQYQPREKTFTQWSGKRTSTRAKLKNFQPTKLPKSERPQRKKRFDSWNL